MRTKRRWKFTKTLDPHPVLLWLIPAVSVLLAFATGALFLALTGHNPIAVYGRMLNGAFGSVYGISETVVKTIPLLLASLGVSVAFRMKLWNIGAEGQIYLGAFAATWVALTFPDLPAYLLLPAMTVAGFVGGAFAALLSALPRAYLSVNETITTLMLNYIAILWVNYFIYGPWRDPAGHNFPLTRLFSKSAALPSIGGTRVHYGLFYGLTAAAVLFFLFRYTRWGYTVRVIGESNAAARYAGFNITRTIITVMLVSGGLAGIAGMTELAGVAHRLQPGLSPGYGYTAIIIAWLARLNPWLIIIAAFLFGALQIGGYAIQTSGLPSATVTMLQGLVLFFVLAADIFTYYRLERIPEKEATANE
ncbi:MAG: ABC transporter permease [bacterium]|jgi:ABC-type uncharacterized transport system permease subunit